MHSFARMVCLNISLIRSQAPSPKPQGHAIGFYYDFILKVDLPRGPWNAKFSVPNNVSYLRIAEIIIFMQSI